MNQRVNDGTTHWEGCESEHHECSLAMLASSQVALRQAVEDRTALRAELAALKDQLVRWGYIENPQEQLRLALAEIARLREALSSQRLRQTTRHSSSCWSSWQMIATLDQSLAKCEADCAAMQAVVEAAVAVDGECPMNLAPIAEKEFGSHLGRVLLELRAAVNARGRKP